MVSEQGFVTCSRRAPCKAQDWSDGGGVGITDTTDLSVDAH